MDVFALAAKISLDTNEYTTSLDEASGKTQTTGEKIKSGLATAAKVGGVAVAGLSAGLVKGAKDTAEYGDAIDKNSQKIGISAQAYQEWDFILQHSGTSVSAFQSGMRTLNNVFADAKTASSDVSSKAQALEEQFESGKITLDEYNKEYESLYSEAYKAIPALDALGFSFMEIDQMTPEEALAAVISRLQEMPEGSERSALAMDLLGRSAMELGPLLNTSAEDTEAMRQKVHDLGGVMSDTAVKDAAAFQDSLQDMQYAFDGVKRTILENLLPVFTQLMNFISDGIAKFRSLDESTQNLILKISGITAVVAPVIVVLGKVITTVGSIGKAMTNIIGVIGKVGTAAKGLFAILAANPIALLVAAIAAAVAALIYFWNTNEDFRNAVKAIWDAIVGFFKGAAEAIKNAFGAIVEFFQGVWEGIKNVFSTVAEVLGGFFSDAWEAIKNAWGAAGEFFSGLWDGIKTKAADAWENIKSKAAAAWDTVKTKWGETKEFFAGVWENVKTSAASAWENVKTKGAEAWANVKENWTAAKAFLADVWSNVKDRAADAWETVKEKGTGAWDKVKNAWESSKEFFAGVWENISSRFSEAPAFFKEKFSNAWENTKSAFGNVKGFFEGKWSDIKGAFSGALAHFKGIGRDMLTGLWNGIADKVEWLKGKVRGVVDKIKGWFTGKDGFDEHSPSKWAKQVFQYVMEGGGQGLDAGSTALFRDVDSIVNRMKDSMDFAPANLAFSASGQPQGMGQTGTTGGGNTYVTINSPVAVDAIQAAREWKKTTQRMALGYV